MLSRWGRPISCYIPKLARLKRGNLRPSSIRNSCLAHSRTLPTHWRLAKPLYASLAAAPGGSMSIGYSINFVGSANLAHRARRVACVAGVKIMNTSLLFAEPLPAIKHLPDECDAASSRPAAMLTIEQRVQIDTFLELLQTWTVGSTAEDASWQVASCFAPRLHRNGDIDFIAPYLPGSHA